MEHWLRAEKELREQPVMPGPGSGPAMADKAPAGHVAAPLQDQKIRPLDEREYPLARGKRNRASREEIRTQQVHSAGRRSH